MMKRPFSLLGSGLMNQHCRGHLDGRRAERGSLFENPVAMRNSLSPAAGRAESRPVDLVDKPE